MIGRRFTLPGLAAMAGGLALACDGGIEPAVFSGPGLTVSHVYATPPLAAGRPAALYMNVVSQGGADALLEVTGPDMERGELHISTEVDGRRTMVRVDSLPVPAGGRLELRPGGAHGMLFGVDPAALDAGSLNARLRFRSGALVAVTASIVAPAELERLLGPAS